MEVDTATRLRECEEVGIRRQYDVPVFPGIRGDIGITRAGVKRVSDGNRLKIRYFDTGVDVSLCDVLVAEQLHYFGARLVSCSRSRVAAALSAIAAISSGLAS